MVGVGDVVAEVDRLAGVVDVAQAIEARIEGADEVAARVVDGRRQPALGVVVQLFAQRVVADDAADGRQHVDEQQRERDVENGGAGDVAQRAEPRVESNPVQQQMQNAERQERQQLERSQQHAEYDEHTGRSNWGERGRARSPES